MLPMGLSMLWESVEPEEALRERFGFDGFEAAGEWVGQVLTDGWGIAAAGCGRMVISDHNAIVWVGSDRGPLVVKWARDSARFAALDASARLLRVLDERGVPVVPPIPARDGRERVVLDGPAGQLSLAVLPEVVGDWLDVEDDAAVWAAGACLADLHNALSGYSDERLSGPGARNGESGPGTLRERVEHWVANDARVTDELRTLLAGLPDLDDAKQLVHNDFRSANLLTRDSKIIGVLDFDEMIWEHRVLDLAHAGVYLATLFRNWQPTSPAVRRTLRAGYESVRPLTPAETRWFDLLVEWRRLTSGF